MTIITEMPNDLGDHWLARLTEFWERDPACTFCLRVEQFAPATGAFLRFDPEQPDDAYLLGLCTPCANGHNVKGRKR
jgi:hypothetical protein